MEEKNLARKVRVKTESTVYGCASYLPLIALFLFVSCAPRVAFYDQVAYDRTVSLKVESLILIDHANEPFTEYEAQVDEILLELEKAYEYSKGRPKNDYTTQQWRILKDPDRNLLVGFFELWEERGTVSDTMIENSKGLVSDAFDTIIGLESGKIRPEE